MNKKISGISGVYLAVDYHPNTDYILNRIASDLNIIPDNGNSDDKEYKYHTTIIYSKTTKPEHLKFTTKLGTGIDEIFPNQKRKPKIQVPIKIIGFGFFDTDKGRNFHVKVSSSFLTSEFNRAIKFGLPTDFPKYQPHITIKNNVPKNFTIPKEIEKKYIGTILYTNNEYIEALTK